MFGGVGYCWLWCTAAGRCCPELIGAGNWRVCCEGRLSSLVGGEHVAGRALPCSSDDGKAAAVFMFVIAQPAGQVSYRCLYAGLCAKCYRLWKYRTSCQ